MFREKFHSGQDPDKKLSKAAKLPVLLLFGLDSALVTILQYYIYSKKNYMTNMFFIFRQIMLLRRQLSFV
jgi:hypothetical protein